jgi:nucleotide-binding universal stress UspA family protein
MPIRDILLQLNSYPERTPGWALIAASELADSCGAQLSGAVCQVHIANVSNALADQLLGMSNIIAGENSKSRHHAKDLLAELASLRGAAEGDPPFLFDCGPLAAPQGLAVRARTYDLTIVPAYGQADLIPTAEGLIFSSGRPVLLLPRPSAASHRLDRIVVGWDGSRPAARALADALPLLAAASFVRIVTILGEKPLEAGSGLSDARRHLLAHRIECETRDVDARGSNAGNVLLEYAQEAEADLLVMGAFGHSRARQFVLGGATRSVLANPCLPVLLSH